jgi:O-antigen/teichoic acid export membrane protein
MLKQAAKNSAFISVGSLSNLVLGIVFAGLTIRYLGEARAGYFIALQAVLGVNALVGGQIFRGPSIQRIAASAAEGRWEDCRRVVATVNVTNSVIGGFFALGLVVSIPLLFRWSKLDGALNSEAAWTTVFIALTFFLDQLAGGFRMVYDALHRFDIVTAMSTGFALLGNLARFIALVACPNMIAIAATGCAVSLLWLAVDLILVRKLLGRSVFLGWSWGILRPMLKFGGWIWGANFAGFLFGNLDRVVLTSYLGSASLPYYAVPLRITNQVHGAIAGQAYLLFPILASAGNRAQEELLKVVDRLRWFAGLVSIFAYVGLALGGPTVLSWLVGPEFAERARWPLYLSCLVYFAWAQTLIYFFALWAVGEPAPNVVTDMASNALSIVTAMVLIPSFGYVGASLALLWRLPFVALHFVWASRVLKIGTGIRGALMPYVSTGCALVLWVVLVKAITPKLPITSLWRLVIVALTIPPALALVWWVETRMFSDKRRWATAQKAFALLWSKGVTFYIAFKYKLIWTGKAGVY